MSDPGPTSGPSDGGVGPQAEQASVVPLPRASTGDIAIALIEDNRLVREGLTALLNKVPSLHVVAGGPSDDPDLLGGVKPHVILLDLGLQNGDSVQVARRVRRDLPDSKIVVMDLLPVQEDIMEFIHVGVSGFIMKDATLEELVRTIRAVVDGVDVLPAAMTSTLFSQIADDVVTNGGREEALGDVMMTAREREVIDLISEGLGNKMIAARLHISIHTVKSHVRNIMEKLALHTRLQIAAYAHREKTE